jgi:hypothetical protein
LVFWYSAVSSLEYRCHSLSLEELIGAIVQVGLDELVVVVMMAIAEEGTDLISDVL